jgi:hypothetical protein
MNSDIAVSTMKKKIKLKRASLISRISKQGELFHEKSENYLNIAIPEQHCHQRHPFTTLRASTGKSAYRHICTFVLTPTGKLSP